jgi:hypothetical protein
MSRVASPKCLLTLVSVDETPTQAGIHNDDYSSLSSLQGSVV